MAITGSDILKNASADALTQWIGSWKAANSGDSATRLQQAIGKQVSLYGAIEGQTGDTDNPAPVKVTPTRLLGVIIPVWVPPVAALAALSGVAYLLVRKKGK